MSDVRLKYWQIAPDGLAKMRELEHYLNAGSGIEAETVNLTLATTTINAWTGLRSPWGCTRGAR